MDPNLCAYCGEKPIEAGRRKYCSKRCATDAAQIQSGKPAAKNPRPHCQLKSCAKLVPVGRRGWCSDEHQADGIGSKGIQARAGRGYDAFVRDGFAKQVADSLLTQQQAAEIRGVDQIQIQRWMAEYYGRHAIDELEGPWELTDQAQAGLDDFQTFRKMVFRTELDEIFETKGFHLKWIRAIEKTIATGGRLQILSPPRHGKTQLLIHFCIWMMLKSPNIRVLWIAASLDLAERWNSSMRDELENNQRLRDLYLPPGKSFRPKAQAWSNKEFVIGTRTVSGIKSPTMTSKGAKGKILSMDADLIICDDLEDDQTTAIPSTRMRVRHWWNTTVLSRKEDHTGLVMIGSRQHVDDLYSVNLESPIWEVIVEHAHDPLCEIPEDEPKKHKDCMLWPERHPFSWLMEQRTEAASSVGIEIFEMVYLNAPVASGLAVFRAHEIDACKDTSSVLRVVPPETVLVGGLDPALTGFQAAFLWAYNVQADTEQMIDMENRKGGGQRGALEIIKEWFVEYQCHYWVVEDMNFQSLYIDDDSEIRKFATANSIMIEGHNTGLLKHDRAFGVAALAPRFATNKIKLPYGDDYSRQRVDQYRNQLIGWSADVVAATGTSRGYRADVVMSSWFPRKVMRRLLAQASVQVEDHSPRSFAGYDLDTYGSEIPWGRSA